MLPNVMDLVSHSFRAYIGKWYLGNRHFKMNVLSSTAIEDKSSIMKSSNQICIIKSIIEYKFMISDKIEKEVEWLPKILKDKSCWPKRMLAISIYWGNQINEKKKSYEKHLIMFQYKKFNHIVVPFVHIAYRINCGFCLCNNVCFKMWFIMDLEKLILSSFCFSTKYETTLIFIGSVKVGLVCEGPDGPSEILHQVQFFELRSNKS